MINVNFLVGMCKPKLLFSYMTIVTEPTEKLVKKVLLSLITCLGGDQSAHSRIIGFIY